MVDEAKSFVAKAVGPSGRATWLTTPRLRGMRAFGPRESAEAFDSYDDALSAINLMIGTEVCDGLRFSIEQVHPA
jgi:hypothetical protein